MPRRILALLLALTAPAVAQEPPLPAPSALPRAAEALQRDDWRGAAEASAAILADDSRPGDHALAWTILGEALRKAGHPYAALTAFGEGLARDPQAAAAWYPAVLELGEQLDEQIWLGHLVARDLSVPMDAQTRAHVALLAARAAFDDGAWGQALGLLPLVLPGTDRHLDAEILRGVTLAQQGRYAEALVPLLTSHESARAAGRDEHLLATLSLNTARAFFAAGNHARAMEYYDQVPREDGWWPQAHYERAWATFRADDMPGTLALLQTHASPFFDDWYLPEAALLRAQALFLLCKFPETSKAIDAFQDRYGPLLAELERVSAELGPHAAWQDVRNWLEGGPSKLPAQVIRRLRADQRLLDAHAAVDAADAELARLAAEQGAWASRAHATLKARRDARVESEGRRILARAEAARSELHSMLADIELTRVDMLSHQADLYARAAETGELELGDRVGKVRELRRKGRRVWPFQGEYWADELGWYRVDTRSECPASLRRGP